MKTVIVAVALTFDPNDGTPFYRFREALDVPGNVAKSIDYAAIESQVVGILDQSDPSNNLNPQIFSKFATQETTDGGQGIGYPAGVAYPACTCG